MKKNKNAASMIEYLFLTIFIFMGGLGFIIWFSKGLGAAGASQSNIDFYKCITACEGEIDRGRFPIYDSDGDGLIDYCDPCPDVPSKFKDGKIPKDSDADGFPDDCTGNPDPSTFQYYPNGKIVPPKDGNPETLDDRKNDPKKQPKWWYKDKGYCI